MAKKAEEPARAWFCGLSFARDEIPVLRALARGEVFTFTTSAYRNERSALESLTRQGFATLTETVENYGTKITQVFAAHPNLFALPVPPVLSFEALAEKMGRSLGKEAQRKWRRKRPLLGELTRRFPSIAELYGQMSIEAKKPEYTKQYPQEEGDVFQFSSRGLTDWYVRQYCSLNNLTL